MSRTLVDFLNLARWLSAFLVVLNHTRHIILPDLKELTNPTVITKGVYFISGFGPEAVDVFFVVSGFLVGGITLRRWLEAGPDVRGYAVSRFSRIYTVLIPALLLIFLFDAAGNYFSPTMYNNGSIYGSNAIPPSIMERTTLPIFIGNLLSTQNILVVPFGSNGPLWSLAYEVWYYILFALLALGLLEKGTLRWSALAVFFAALYFVGINISVWGIIWATGVASFFYLKSTYWAPKPWLSLAIFLAIVVVARLSHNTANEELHEGIWIQFGRELPLSLAFGLVIVSIGRHSTMLVIPVAAFNKLLAEFSFSTYILHKPVLLATVAALEACGLTVVRSDFYAGILEMTGLIAVSYAACFLFYMLAERHTQTVKSLLLTGVHRRINADQ